MNAGDAARTFVTLETAEIGRHCRGDAIVSSSEAIPKNCFVLDPLRDKRWHEFIKKHPLSSVFHSAEWLSALHLAYGYEPVVFTNNPPSTELTSGIVFCRVKSWLTGRRLVSLPFSDHCEPLVGTNAEFDDLLARVRESVDDNEWDYGEIRPISFEPGASNVFGRDDRYCWHAIDLRPSIDDIARNLHSSVRRKIRRAEREALVCGEGTSEQLLCQFYELLVSTRRRQHLPPQPMKWFRCLIASFGSKLKVRVSYKNGVPIASILTLDYKDTVTYKYGCSDAPSHSLGGVALLLWETIQQAKAAGHATLDLGRSDRSNGGLTTFKEHWGGIRSSLSYWRYPNRPPSRQSSWMKGIPDPMMKVTPDCLLVAAGNLLYRHIG